MIQRAAVEPDSARHILHDVVFDEKMLIEIHDRIVTRRSRQHIPGWCYCDRVRSVINNLATLSHARPFDDNDMIGLCSAIDEGTLQGTGFPIAGVVSDGCIRCAGDLSYGYPARV